MQQSLIASRTLAINSLVSGYIDEGASYLKLKQINESLVVQNKTLMSELYGKEKANQPDFKTISDKNSGGQVYSFVDGEVVFNSINRRDNYFTINRGTLQGVDANMGVIAPNGIAGIVINTTDNYALVKSILSVNKIKISAALKKSGYFGTLFWKGDDSRSMTLSDIPKYVSIKVGDTIVTDGKSAIFPANIPIGTIAGYEVDSKTGFWDITVELSEKIGKLNHVYVVHNLRKLDYNKIEDSLKVQIKKDDK